MNDHCAEDEYAEVDMPPLLESTSDMTVKCTFHGLPFCFYFFSLQSLAMYVFFVFRPSTFLGQAQESIPILLLKLSFSVAALGQLPGLICSSLCFFSFCSHVALCLSKHFFTSSSWKLYFPRVHPLHRKFAPMLRSCLAIRSAFPCPL